MKIENKAVDFLSREYQLTKSDWLSIAIQCLETSNLIKDYPSLEMSKKSITYVRDYEREKE